MRHLNKLALAVVIGVPALFFKGFLGEAGKDAWHSVTSWNQRFQTAWYDVGSEYVEYFSPHRPKLKVDSASVPEGDFVSAPDYNPKYKYKGSAVSAVPKPR